jgi:hypothetical protein
MVLRHSTLFSCILAVLNSPTIFLRKGFSFFQQALFIITLFHRFRTRQGKAAMVRAAFFNYLTSWFQRQTRLRNVLLVPFTVQLVGAVSLVVFLWFLAGNQAVNDLAVQLQGRASKQVEEHLNKGFRDHD